MILQPIQDLPVIEEHIAFFAELVRWDTAFRAEVPFISTRGPLVVCARFRHRGIYDVVYDGVESRAG